MEITPNFGPNATQETESSAGEERPSTKRQALDNSGILQTGSRSLVVERKNTSILPDDLLCMMFKEHLEGKDLIKCTEVCKAWKNLISFLPEYKKVRAFTFFNFGVRKMPVPCISYSSPNSNGALNGGFLSAKLLASAESSDSGSLRSYSFVSERKKMIEKFVGRTCIGAIDQDPVLDYIKGQHGHMLGQKYFESYVIAAKFMLTDPRLTSQRVQYAQLVMEMFKRHSELDKLGDILKKLFPGVHDDEIKTIKDSHKIKAAALRIAQNSLPSPSEELENQPYVYSEDAPIANDLAFKLYDFLIVAKKCIQRGDYDSAKGIISELSGLDLNDDDAEDACSLCFELFYACFNNENMKDSCQGVFDCFEGIYFDEEVDEIEQEHQLVEMKIALGQVESACEYLFPIDVDLEPAFDDRFESRSLLFQNLKKYGHASHATMILNNEETLSLKIDMLLDSIENLSKDDLEKKIVEKLIDETVVLVKEQFRVNKQGAKPSAVAIDQACRLLEAIYRFLPEGNYKDFHKFLMEETSLLQEVENDTWSGIKYAFTLRSIGLPVLSEMYLDASKQKILKNMDAEILKEHPNQTQMSPLLLKGQVSKLLYDRLNTLMFELLAVLNEQIDLGLKEQARQTFMQINRPNMIHVDVINWQEENNSPLVHASYEMAAWELEAKKS